MIKKGARHIDALGEKWGPLACGFHAGSVVLETETRQAPGQEPMDVPVKRSEDVGHQPDCDDCQLAAVETKQHVAAVTADRERATIEFERLKRQREGR